MKEENNETRMRFESQGIQILIVSEEDQIVVYVDDVRQLTLSKSKVHEDGWFVESRIREQYEELCEVVNRTSTELKNSIPIDFLKEEQDDHNKYESNKYYSGEFE